MFWHMWRVVIPVPLWSPGQSVGRRPASPSPWSPPGTWVRGLSHWAIPSHLAGLCHCSSLEKPQRANPQKIKSLSGSFMYLLEWKGRVQSNYIAVLVDGYVRCVTDDLSVLEETVDGDTSLRGPRQCWDESKGRRHLCPSSHYLTSRSHLEVQQETGWKANVLGAHGDYGDEQTICTLISIVQNVLSNMC